jgi:D-alanyl-D-alanine carboxypeptidase/D-alanyl-D-alanine-endopeptidase (penicillin-binding protein 4)
VAPSAQSASDRARDRQAAAQVEPRADLARFRARVEATLAQAGADKGYWGVLIVDAGTGEVLFALNPQRYFIPASNAKLFTTALAMATLGSDYRFRTTIETRGALNRNGRLRGDLVLVGRGDPNLSNRKFPLGKEVERDGPPEKLLAELADVVVARGVRRVEGDVVADDSYFAYERFPSGWAIDDVLWRDGAAVSALAINDNSLFLELRPGGRLRAPAWFGVEPWAGYYRIQNEITTGPQGSEQKLKVSREPGSRLIVLSGTIPLKAEPHTLALAVEEPAEHAAHLLKRLLEARGVRIRGQARARHAPEMSSGARVVLADHTSVPLIDAVRVVNKVSQNLHAELLLRAAAREKTGATDTEAALKFLQEFLKGIGIEEGDVILFDGSGLSRRNLVTPQAVVKLLAYAAQQPWAEVFRSTLPIAGEDGTLADRMKGTPAADRIWAKTGSLDHVRSLAGYATTVHGAQVIFSVFGNNHNLRGKAATSVVDAICAAMIEELGAAREEKKAP